MAAVRVPGSRGRVNLCTNSVSPLYDFSLCDGGAFTRSARFGSRLTTLSTREGSVLVMPDRSKRPPIRSSSPRAALRATVAAVLAGALGLAALTGGGTAVAVPVTKASPPAGERSGGTDYTKLVDPFVSTAGDDGNDLPGAQAPHSLAKVNPMTTPGRNHSGYDYNEDHIAGFTATNLDGVGGSGGGGDLLVVPTSQQYDKRPATSTYAHPYSHDDESATPGSYRVGLGSPSGTIDAEMTATTRTALERYAFPRKRGRSSSSTSPTTSRAAPARPWTRHG